MSLNPVVTAMEEGSAAFASVWRAWATQWSQPKLLTLADTYLGARLFHSSQISGFSSRDLRRPAPMTFVVVGYLNLAHARSLGIRAQIEDAPDIGLPAKLPESLRALWEGQEPLRDASGVVLGPAGLFLAFSGLRELPHNTERTLAPDQAEAASEALGRHLRLSLATNGVDWLTEMPTLRKSNPVLADLLMGKSIQSDRLLAQLPRIAAVAETTDDALWNVISRSLAT